MNKKIIKMAIAALACVTICGTTLAAPAPRGGRGPAPAKQQQKNKQAGEENSNDLLPVKGFVFHCKKPHRKGIIIIYYLIYEVIPQVCFCYCPVSPVSPSGSADASGDGEASGSSAFSS